MRAFLTESCIDKLIQLAVGVGVVGAVGATGGVAAAIGAGQMAVTGLAGLGAIAAGRAIQSRVKEDDTARAVLAAVTKACGQVWLATGSEDAGIAQDVVKVLDEGLDRLDFPITSIRAIRAAAGQGDGLYAALADAMLARLDDPFGLLKTPRHHALARDILSDAVRAGVLARENLLKATILEVTDMAVMLGRANLAATREEGAATRDAMAAESAGVVTTIREEGAAIRASNAESVAQLLAVFERSDRAADAREAHLTRALIVQLARRIARDVADFDTALTELDRAVTIAMEVM